MTDKLIELEAKLYSATSIVKQIRKEMRTASFRSLSNYSKKLKDGELQQAIEAQMDVLEEMAALVPSGDATEYELIKIVKRATR